jgi:hypothetical protein
MPLNDVNLKFSLDSSGIKKGLARTKKDIANFSKSAGASFAAAFGGAAITAAITSLGRNAMRTASEIKDLAQISGASTTEFQKQAQAARTVNIEQEKLADIFKDTNDKIGDFLQTGGGPLKDFFENIAPKVGATAEEFIGLSGPQALQRYFTYLEKANLSQQDMTFYMEAIASDATRLIPLLQAGGDGFKRLGEEAAEAGRVMDEATIEALDRANERIDRFTQRATVAIGAVLAAVFGDEKSKLEKKAAKELLDEGKIKRKVRGGSKQDKERKKLIDDRVNAIKEENKEAKKADIKKTIEINKQRQITHQKKQQLKLQKKLNATQTFDAADTNQSGYVTPKEQRRAERADRKADRERRKKQAAERSAERGQGDRERRAKTAADFAARERAAGLHLPAFGFGGKKAPQPQPQEGEKKQSIEQALLKSSQETAEGIKTIANEVTQ